MAIWQESKRGTSVNPLGSSNNFPWLYCVAATQLSLDNQNQLPGQ